MINIIVSHCRNGGIGFKTQVPWTLGADLNRFRFLTVGNKNNSVIMGRKRWENLGSNALSDRTNIIISKTMKTYSNDVNVFKTIEDANEYCRSMNFDENWVIGGSEIYGEYLRNDIVDLVYTTDINMEFECDTFFPELTNYKLIKSYSVMNGRDVVYTNKTYGK